MHDYLYPAELFFGMPSEEAWHKSADPRAALLLRLLNNFDSLNARNERCIVQIPPEEYRGCGRGRRFEARADVVRCVTEIQERFLEINEGCRALGLPPFFSEPEDAAASYFLRDLMMLTLPREDAERVLSLRDVMLREFREKRQSQTLKEIVGKSAYRALMKPYRIN